MKYVHFDDDSTDKADRKAETKIFKLMVSKSVNMLPDLMHNEYIPNKYPPDIEFAKRHGKANRIAKALPVLENEKIDVCECCGCHIQNLELEYCCDRLEMAEFGTGFPLYFEFVFYCIIMLVLIFLCLGIYGLYTNYSSGDCSNPLANCSSSNFINKISIPNKILHPETYDQQAWVNLATVIVVMISLHIFRRMQKLTENECDRGVISPSDYSVWLSNLPKGHYTERDIRQIFEEEAAKGGQSVFEIKKVVLAFNISDFMVKCRKINQLESKIRKIEKAESLHEISPKGRSKNSLEMEKVRIEGELQTFMREAEVFDQTMIEKTTGDAFVIFKEQDDRQFVEEKFGPKARLCCADTDRLKIGNKHVHVVRSPEPNDIIWENLGFSDWHKFKKRIFTNLMTFLVLIICFALILSLSELQADMNEKAKASSSTIQYLIKLLGYISSFLIVFINSCLLITIRKFANLECHSTLTSYNVSVAEKLSLAQFCNTALIIFLANYLLYSVKNIFCEGGLITDLYSVFLCNAFIPVLTTYFNPWYGWRLYKRKRIEKEGSRCFVTQKEANEIYEGGPLDMAYKYGILVKTMWFTCFYACIMPIGIIFSLCNVIFTYFLDKYLILRRYTRPPMLSSKLNQEMIESLEYCPFIMSLGSLFFHVLLYNYDMSNMSLLPDFIAIGLTCINFIFPSAKFNDLLCPITDLTPDATTYDVAKKSFVTDYDRSNPITQKKALEEYVHYMEIGESLHKFQGGNSLENYGRGINTPNKILMNNIIPLKVTAKNMNTSNQIQHDILTKEYSKHENWNNSTTGNVQTSYVQRNENWNNVNNMGNIQAGNRGNDAYLNSEFYSSSNRPQNYDNAPYLNNYYPQPYLPNQQLRNNPYL